MNDGKSVAVVGAGIMGLCTAYYLAKSGRCHEIVLIEEGEVAGGASGRAAGFLARDWHGAPTRSLGKLSYELHEEVARELDGPSRYGYRKVASLSMRVATGLGDGSSHSLSSSWVDANNVSDVSAIEEAQGGGTAQLHPRLFCQVLLQECLSLGVQLRRARAESVDGNHSVRLSNGETINSDAVVLCCGPWTGRVAKELWKIGVDVRDLAGHSLVIRTAGPIPPVAIFASLSSKDATATPELFSRPDGTVYIAGENTGAPLPPGTASVETAEASLDRLLAACKLISPALASGTVVERALCYRPVTSRGYPYLCSLSDSGLPGCYICAGHGPWGISLSLGSGKVMSEIILDGHASSADVPYLQKS